MFLQSAYYDSCLDLVTLKVRDKDTNARKNFFETKRTSFCNHIFIQQDHDNKKVAVAILLGFSLSHALTRRLNQQSWEVSLRFEQVDTAVSFLIVVFISENAMNEQSGPEFSTAQDETRTDSQQTQINILSPGTNPKKRHGSKISLFHVLIAMDMR